MARRSSWASTNSFRPAEASLDRTNLDFRRRHSSTLGSSDAHRNDHSIFRGDAKQDGISKQNYGAAFNANKFCLGLEFAKMRNPTVALNLTRRRSIEFTYAELLQYASIVLASVQLYSAYWPRPKEDQSLELTHGSGKEISNCRVPTSSNIIIVFIGLASLEARRKAEHFGLRRIALILCALLFLFTCIANRSALLSRSCYRGKFQEGHAATQEGALDTLEIVLCDEMCTTKKCLRVETLEENRMDQALVDLASNVSSMATIDHISKLCDATHMARVDRAAPRGLPVIGIFFQSTKHRDERHELYIRCDVDVSSGDTDDTS